MIRLTRSLQAWGTPEFPGVLKQEVMSVNPEQLPLQDGLSAGSHALGGGFEVMIIAVSEGENAIRVRAGIFYSGIIAGCSCADDPTPVEPHGEYCEVQLEIDRHTAETTVSLLAE